MDYLKGCDIDEITVEIVDHRFNRNPYLFACKREDDIKPKSNIASHCERLGSHQAIAGALVGKEQCKSQSPISNLPVG